MCNCCDLALCFNLRMTEPKSVVAVPSNGIYSADNTHMAVTLLSCCTRHMQLVHANKQTY